MRPFEYHRPSSLEEAIGLLTDGSARVLAGGTDLMVNFRAGRELPAAVVSLRDIPGLDVLQEDGDGIEMGARVTLADVITSELVAQRAPMLVTTAQCMANVNVRNRATVIGNLCNASPAADMAGPLMALDAEIRIAGSGGERRIPVADLFTGPRENCLAAGELAVALHIPAQRGDCRYERLANRRNADLALASASVRVLRDADGLVTEARIAMGAVTATPRRCDVAEKALLGRPLDDNAIAVAAAAVEAAAQPIDDVRASAWYRTEMVRNLTRRGLDAIAANGGEA